MSVRRRPRVAGQSEFQGSTAPTHGQIRRCQASQGAPDGLARTKFKVDHSGDAKQSPLVEKMDISVLEIDETYDADCDPYNSTGQFLVDALKKKRDE